MVEDVLNFVRQPWPWYVAGPLLGLAIPLLLITGNKALGISSTLRHVCAAVAPGRVPFLRYDWKREVWNLWFAAGIVLGGYLGANVFSHLDHVTVSYETSAQLRSAGVETGEGFAPPDVFGWEGLLSLRGMAMVILGGFLVGFGTRYAGGCTSGHGLMGTANLQWPSFLALVAFFAGGIAATHLLLPFVLTL